MKHITKHLFIALALTLCTSNVLSWANGRGNGSTDECRHVPGHQQCPQQHQQQQQQRQLTPNESACLHEAEERGWQSIPSVVVCLDAVDPLLPIACVTYAQNTTDWLPDLSIRSDQAWPLALQLCRGARSESASIECAKRALAAGLSWDVTIRACQGAQQ